MNKNRKDKKTAKSQSMKNMPKMDGRTAKHPMQTFKRIMGYLAPYKWLLVFAMFCMLANVICNIGGTFMLSIIIDDYILPLAYKGGVLTDAAYASRAAEVTLASFGGIVGIMASLYLFGALLHYIFNYIVVRITTKVLQNIRNEMFEKMEKLPIKFFDTHTHGELMSCFTNDTDTLREFLSSGLPNFISNAFTVLGMFVMMCVISPLLTLCIVLMLAIMLLIIKFIAGKSGTHFVKQQQEIGALNGYIEEHINGLKVVKVFCHEDAEKIGFDEHNKALRHASRKANTYANMLMPIMSNLDRKSVV